MTGCSVLGLGSKKVPEVVSSCFSEGDNQELTCKSQRVTEDGRIAVTRCIGSGNQETALALRGKCAEKICSAGSQTDCQVRGEHLVIEKYAELATAKLFNAEDAPHSVSASKLAHKDKKSKLKGRQLPVEIASAPEPVTVSPAAEAVAPPKKQIVKETPEVRQEMTIALTPIKKSRAPASVAGSASAGAYKKVCISKSEASAPAILRGKCATRTCKGGKCTYQGRKEMFDWVAK